MFKKGCILVFVLLVSGALLGLLVSAVITYQMPRKYESEAIIEVKGPAPEVQPTENSASTVNTSDSRFYATEFERIKSRKCLEQVCNHLKLAERWNMDARDAADTLRKMVDCRNIHGTDLVSIRVRSASAADARDIAAEVVRAYQNARTSIERTGTAAALDEMNRIIRDQEDKLEERRKILSTIVRNKGIIDPGSGSTPLPPETGASGRSDGSRDKAIQHALDMQDHADAKRDFESDQKLLEQFKLKRVSMEIQARIPSSSVEIHDEPVVSKAPVSPNVTLNLVLGTVAGLILFPIAGLLVMGVAALARGKPQQ